MKSKKIGLKNNIWKLYLHKILGGMFFSVPVMVLFWQDNGLSLTEIMILQSIFSILVVVFEIPTGYFADIFGRKISLIISSLAAFLGIFFYSLGYSFNQFLVAELFFAIAISFSSGTMAAFVYDTLKDLKREGEYKKIWGNAFFYGMISLAISSILGGFLAKVDLRYTLYASVPFFALLIPVTLSMQESQRHKVIFEKGYVRELFNIMKSILGKNKKIKWIIVYSGIIYAFNQSTLWLYQPYFKISGLDVIYFGFIFAGFQFVAAFSSKYAYLIEEKLGRKYSLLSLIFLVAVSYLLMSHFIFLFSFSFCFIQQFVRGFKGIVVTDYINKLTASGVRATVLSVNCSFSGLGGGCL